MKNKQEQERVQNLVYMALAKCIKDQCGFGPLVVTIQNKNTGKERKFNV